MWHHDGQLAWSWYTAARLWKATWAPVKKDEDTVRRCRWPEHGRTSQCASAGVRVSPEQALLSGLSARCLTWAHAPAHLHEGGVGLAPIALPRSSPHSHSPRFPPAPGAEGTQRLSPDSESATCLRSTAPKIDFLFSFKKWSEYSLEKQHLFLKIRRKLWKIIKIT